MPNPTQPAIFFEGLSTGPNFDRSYEVQDTIPIDGSKASLRSFSPFVIRALPPLILGDRANILQVARPQSSSEGVNVSSSVPTDYAGAIRGLNQTRRSRAEDTYQSILRAGVSIPGISAASLSSIEEGMANSARNQAISPTIANSSQTRIVPALANDSVALTILVQLKKLLDTPPLVLLINPTTFSVNHAKIAQFQERNRYGYIYQSWGEELVKVSFSCTVGAFIAGKTSPTQRAASGVQYASKRDSASFQQLMSVLSIYQSSGNLADLSANATGRRSRANYMVGNLAIEYDQNVYVGHMDSFSYAEEETLQNGGLKFSIDFTAVRVYDTAPQRVALAPQNAPGSNFYNSSAATAPAPGSRISRTFRGSQTQFFTAPTVGGNTPPQPWTGASVATEPETGDVVISRRT